MVSLTIALTFIVAHTSYGGQFQIGFGASGHVEYMSMEDFQKDKEARSDIAWDEFSYSVPHSGYGGGIEVRAKAYRYFWGAIGIGHMRGSGKYEASDTEVDYWLYVKDEITVSAVPITLTMGGFLPLQSFSLYGGVGSGLYLSKLRFEETRRYEESLPYYWENRDAEGELSAKGLGFHIVGGLEFFPIRQVAIFGEGIVRVAKVSKFKGGWEYSIRDSDGQSSYESGDGYAIMRDYNGDEFFLISLDEPGPRERWMNAEFSGLSFQVGIRFYFLGTGAPRGQVRTFELLVFRPGSWRRNSVDMNAGVLVDWLLVLCIEDMWSGCLRCVLHAGGE